MTQWLNKSFAVNFRILDWVSDSIHSLYFEQIALVISTPDKYDMLQVYKNSQQENINW